MDYGYPFHLSQTQNLERRKLMKLDDMSFAQLIVNSGICMTVTIVVKLINKIH